MKPHEYTQACVDCKRMLPLSAFVNGLVRCADCREPLHQASVSYEVYDGAELRPFAGRPGAMDAFEQPSRHMNVRTWRDGRTEVAP